MRRWMLILPIALMVAGAVVWAATRWRATSGVGGSSAPRLAPPVTPHASESSLSPDEQSKALLSAYFKSKREMSGSADGADAVSVKRQWLGAFLALARSVDQAEVPGGFMMAAIDLARELRDNDAVMELSLLAAEGSREPRDRLLAMVQYIEAAREGLAQSPEAWDGYASTLKSFAADVLRSTPSVTGSGAGAYLPGAESVVYQAAEALTRAERPSEAAELETAAAPLFAERAERELSTVPPSMKSAEAYRRAASRWVKAGNRERALELVRGIAALPNAEHDASWYMLNIARAADPRGVEIDTGLASDWLATRQTWTSVNDLKLAEALMLAYAHGPGNERAAEAFALGERILYREPELLRQADEDVLASLSKTSPGLVGRTNVTANTLQAMASAARKLGDREAADQLLAEFIARFPEHPSNKARASKSEK